jgi:hypothetical protein
MLPGTTDLPGTTEFAARQTTLQTLHRCFATTQVDAIKLPQSYERARAHPHAAKFQEGMDLEMKKVTRPQLLGSCFTCLHTCQHSNHGHEMGV